MNAILSVAIKDDKLPARIDCIVPIVLLGPIDLRLCEHEQTPLLLTNAYIDGSNINCKHQFANEKKEIANGRKL